MHTSRRISARRSLQSIKKNSMKEYVKDEWGLRTLRTDEMLTRGGLTFRELWNLLNILGEAVKKAEKYWPKFRDGFQAGWEAA